MRPFILKPTIMSESLVVRTGSKLLPVAASQILYVKSSGKLCTIKTADRDYHVRMPLNDLEQCLPADNFVRIHRSFLISLKHIVEINAMRVIVGAKSLPVSRKGRNQLIRCYTLVR